MVLCDWSKLSPADQTDVRTRLAQLENTGFILRGDTYHESEGTSDDTDMTLVAELRKAIGTRVFLSESATSAIRDWLDGDADSDGDFALAVWIASDGKPGTSGKITTWLVAQTDMDSNITTVASTAVGSSD